MFADDRESDVKTVEFEFMHAKIDGFWDWPKCTDRAIVESKYVFYGPCQPSPPVIGKGFRFPEEEDAKKLYVAFKNKK